MGIFARQGFIDAGKSEASRWSFVLRPQHLAKLGHASVQQPAERPVGQPELPADLVVIRPAEVSEHQWLPIGLGHHAEQVEHAGTLFRQFGEIGRRRAGVRDQAQGLLARRPRPRPARVSCARPGGRRRSPPFGRSRRATAESRSPRSSGEGSSRRRGRSPGSGLPRCAGRRFQGKAGCRPAAPSCAPTARTRRDRPSGREGRTPARRRAARATRRKVRTAPRQSSPGVMLASRKSSKGRLAVWPIAAFRAARPPPAIDDAVRHRPRRLAVRPVRFHSRRSRIATFMAWTQERTTVRRRPRKSCDRQSYSAQGEIPPDPFLCGWTH